MNGIARVQNANTHYPTELLSPRLNPATNTFVEGFPQTTEEIRRMTSRTLNTVLEGLGLPTDGNVEERRRQLRGFIGLSPNERAHE